MAARTLAIALLALSCPALLILLVLPGGAAGRGGGRAGPLLLALLVALLPMALAALGAVRGRGGGRLGRLAWALGFVALLLAGSAAGVVLLSGRSEPTVLGLPPATLLALAGLWIVPLPLVALIYALTFDRSGVTWEDLEALRRRAGKEEGESDGTEEPSRGAP